MRQMLTIGGPTILIYAARRQEFSQYDQTRWANWPTRGESLRPSVVAQRCVYLTGEFDADHFTD